MPLKRADLLLRTIAPFNEPNTIYWWAGNNQEGCHFDVSTQNTIITKLASKLEVMFPLANW